ncbi:MAG: ATP-binding cassette domain-containing protein [Saprospiraceae bacterium]|nr:ATP-binding cassette domain-containing protein [Saprospiraceae bacterium]
MLIELIDLSFKYDFRPSFVLENINLQIKNGEVVALMGTSGSGKSTLIKIISAFLKPTSGAVLINGKRVQVNKPYKSIAYVSQSSLKTLFPWLTVEENIYYPNKLRNKFDLQAKKYCDELLAILKIEDERESYPMQLSGGQQKRLSLALALSYKPEIILLDEPFSGIDFKLSEELWDVLYLDFQIRKPSVLFITHSLDEAAILADRVIFLNNFKTLNQAVKTVNDFEFINTIPRYELLMRNESIQKYRNYLLEQFNSSTR